MPNVFITDDAKLFVDGHEVKDKDVMMGYVKHGNGSRVAFWIKLSDDQAILATFAWEGFLAITREAAEVTMYQRQDDA